MTNLTPVWCTVQVRRMLLQEHGVRKSGKVATVTKVVDITHASRVTHCALHDTVRNPTRMSADAIDG